MEKNLNELLAENVKILEERNKNLQELLSGDTVDTYKFKGVIYNVNSNLYRIHCDFKPIGSKVILHRQDGLFSYRQN